MKKHLSILLTVLFLFLMAWGGYLFYRHFLRPMRIAVVSEYDAAWVEYQEAVQGTNFTVHRYKRTQIASAPFENYDLVMLSAMGWQPENEQVANLQKARNHGVSIHVASASGKQVDELNNLPEAVREKFQRYLAAKGSENLRNGLLYLARELKGYQTDIPDPKPRVQRGYFHLGDTLFETIEAYDAHLDERYPGLSKTAPRVVLSGAWVNVYNKLERGAVDRITQRLLERGCRVYALMGGGNETEKWIDACKPDALIFFPMSRLLPGDDVVAYLTKRNIPCFDAINISGTKEEWLNEPTALSAGSTSVTITLPELDGIIEPTAVAARETDEEGLSLRTPIDERIAMLVKRIDRWMTLKRKANGEKKVAIVYFKAPGHSPLGGSGMETIESLYNVLHKMQQEGYDLGGRLPDTSRELAEMIQREGCKIGGWAEGAWEHYLQHGDPVFVPAEEYAAWLRRDVPGPNREALIRLWGHVPGKQYSVQKEGKPYLVVTRVQLGNIALMPQPAVAVIADGPAKANGSVTEGEGVVTDEVSAVHGTDQPPPHSYVGAYLWIRHGFKADAVVHFGTHGSLEYTKGKSIALSDYCWPTLLIGDLPHLYYYVVSNIGEAMIAKRRSSAVIITHATPPFTKARLYGDLEEIHQKIHDYESVEGETLKAEILKTITGLVRRNDMFKEIGYDRTPPEETVLGPEQFEKLHEHLHLLAEENIQEGLHVIGRPGTRRQIIDTVVGMLGDRGAELVKQVAGLEILPDLPKEETETEALTYFVTNVLSGHIHEETHPTDDGEHPFALLLQATRRHAENLSDSTRLELDRFLNGLSGGYIPPSSGGDVILNPESAPTGRNMASINLNQTPTPESYRVGIRLTETIIENFQRRNPGQWPRRVACTLWAGEHIRTRGVVLAQALYLMGLKPKRDKQNNVFDVEIIPSEELGRPRIDIVAQTSGPFRDTAISRIELLDKAVRIVAALPDETYPNYVRENALQTESDLKMQGLAAAEAREYATARIFGSSDGTYGTGTRGDVDGAEPEDAARIADKYIDKMGGVYRSGKVWGKQVQGLFESQLKGTEFMIQSRSSNTWGPLTLDDLYDYNTLALAIREKTGTDPILWFSDMRNPSSARAVTVTQAIREEARSSLWNPKYIEGKQKEGAGAAEKLIDPLRQMRGWNVVQPSAIDETLWDEMHAVYIDDKHELDMKGYFEAKNPYALQDMTAIMLDVIRKGMWTPSDDVVRNLAERHVEAVEKFGAGCSSDTCGDPKLHAFLGEVLGGLPRDYEVSLNQALKTQGAPKPEVRGMQLEEKIELLKNENEDVMTSAPFFIVMIILGMMAVLSGGFVRETIRCFRYTGNGSVFPKHRP